MIKINEYHTSFGEFDFFLFFLSHITLFGSLWFVQYVWIHCFVGLPSFILTHRLYRILFIATLYYPWIACGFTSIYREIVQLKRCSHVEMDGLRRSWKQPSLDHKQWSTRSLIECSPSNKWKREWPRKTWKRVIRDASRAKRLDEDGTNSRYWQLWRGMRRQP